MSELSCDTPFIGRNDTDDLSLYLSSVIVINSQKPQSTCAGGARKGECVMNATRSACARGNMAQWVARADNGIIVVAC